MIKRINTTENYEKESNYEYKHMFIYPPHPQAHQIYAHVFDGLV